MGDDNTPLYASTMGEGVPLMILHGGGPDRQSIIPFAKILGANYQVIFPDIRGYGQSICYDPSKHTWSQYAKDVISLINFIGINNFFICGMGLGASIAERVAYTYPDMVKGVILISPETFDKEGEGSSLQEIEMMEKCAKVSLTEGLEIAWEPFMKDLSPAITSAVRESFDRTDVRSFAAAMAIVHSKRLESFKQLSEISAPVLIIPGTDKRHNANTSNIYLEHVSQCKLGKSFDWNEIQTIEQLAVVTVPQINEFLNNHK